MKLKTEQNGLNSRKDLDFLLEWASWAHLDSKTEVELILLKGHLLVEIVLGEVLKRNSISHYKNYSFYHKIAKLETIIFKDVTRKQVIIGALKQINNLRNHLAHEFNFNIRYELDIWAINIMNELEGTKFTRYTFRTRITHSFSILTKNLLELG